MNLSRSNFALRRVSKQTNLKSICTFFASRNSNVYIVFELRAIHSTMSAEEAQPESGYEDGGAGGPGAPTPLAALEVHLADDCDCLLQSLR